MSDLAPDPTADTHVVKRRASLATMVIAALGVVYGDIGTSPLYALRECFLGTHARRARPTRTCSACCRSILWSLILIVSRQVPASSSCAPTTSGEGGILALIALARRAAPTRAPGSAGARRCSASSARRCSTATA